MDVRSDPAETRAAGHETVGSNSSSSFDPEEDDV
jgi:hypothetical protein